MIDVYINDQKYEVKKDTILIDACSTNGIPVPTLCFHPSLPGFAGCRLCVVELRKGDWSKLVAACEYPIRRTEHFYTDSDMVQKNRRMTAKLLIARAPEAQEVLEDILGEPIEPEFEPLDVFNKRCVLCGLCYRVCHAQGTGAIYTAGRGTDKVVETPYKEANEDCIGCQACVAVCPTGAIHTAEPNGKRAIWRHMFELLPCPICGERHITQRMIEYMKAKTGLPEEDIRICPSCRQKRIGSGMLTGLSHEKATQAFMP